MLTLYRDALSGLERAGWKVTLKSPEHPKSLLVKERFSWLQPEVVEFLCGIDIVANKADQAWLLSMGDFLESSASAFAWNEWEKLSLEAAATPDQARRIREFWEVHFPILFTVKNGYGYMAIRKKDSRIVCGEEPEFEKTEIIASTFEELLRQIGNGDSRLNRWL